MDRGLSLRSIDGPVYGQTMNGPEIIVAVIGTNVAKVNHHQISILYNRFTRAQK